jgi:hypothetical protein
MNFEKLQELRKAFSQNKIVKEKFKNELAKQAVNQNSLLDSFHVSPPSTSDDEEKSENENSSINSKAILNDLKNSQFVEGN